MKKQKLIISHIKNTNTPNNNLKPKTVFESKSVKVLM